MKCNYCGGASSGEFCWRHMPKKPLKRTSLKKVSNKRREQLSLPKNNDMWDFFLDIWKERKHRSEVSGTWLGNEPKTYMFDHLLEKSKYPELRLKKWNIALVTLEEHDAKTNGHPLPKHKELIDKAYELYRKGLQTDELSSTIPVIGIP